ncbi:MAG: helix-turn-helix transcriptional regulator [Corynebacterium sp.]|uniref:helix-turn-helix transcriptional regulator n=1 Tax=Corynebacterium sp. TaxID=1720 RepID=UPI0026DAFB78|nr:helix-turn-helix transcriptional regulator [Corynebacterium sp.]MDO5030924.1 helix-turn-helix transcriptional regulator [Corynebacterium sp.]
MVNAESSCFGARLRQLRTNRGMTTRDLADATDGVVSQSAVSRLENGKAAYSLDQAMALAWAFGVPVDELVEENPVSQRVQAVARTSRDGASVKEAQEMLLPYLQLRVLLTQN